MQRRASSLFVLPNARHQQKTNPLAIQIWIQKQTVSQSVTSLKKHDQAADALSFAAVLRGGLSPPTPPLRRYAERISGLILHALGIALR
jgi:hypothetical protein